MRSDLDHLPASKRRQLGHVVRVLFEEFEIATRLATQDWKKVGRILKVILYGSHARGDWVDDRSSGYQSDYDILVVVNDARLTDIVDYWSAAEDRLMRDVLVTRRLRAPVGLIVHDLADVNDRLARGRPFFVDIARQGIALYEAEGFDLAAPGMPPPEEAQAEAGLYFEDWFPTIGDALRGAARYQEDGVRKDAAFTLHQAIERAYHCTLLTLTLYSPKSHNLNFLRRRVEGIAPALIAAWPRADRVSRRRFALVRRAYVEARYSRHYKISDEELRWIAERAGILEMLVRSVCERSLASRG